MQLSILKNARTSNCYILGDFNLDAEMGHRPDYNYKIPMTSHTNFTIDANLIQLVTFKTWSRTIKGVKTESLLDYVYLNNFAQVSNIEHCTSVFGDHVLIMIDLNLKLLNTEQLSFRRDWSHYLAQKFHDNLACKMNLSGINWFIHNVGDQHANEFCQIQIGNSAI